MAEYRSSSYTVYDIKYHFVWITKYRYKILIGKIAEKIRDIAIGRWSKWNSNFERKCRFGSCAYAVVRSKGNSIE